MKTTLEHLNRQTTLVASRQIGSDAHKDAADMMRIMEESVRKMAETQAIIDRIRRRRTRIERLGL